MFPKYSTDFKDEVKKEMPDNYEEAMIFRYRQLLEALSTRNVAFIESICKIEMTNKIKEGIESFPKVTVRAQETDLTRIEAVKARLDLGVVEGLKHKQMSVGPLQKDYPMHMNMSNKHGSHTTYDVFRVILKVTSN